VVVAAAVAVVAAVAVALLVVAPDAPAVPVAPLAVRRLVTAASAEARRFPIARRRRRFNWPGSIIDPANSYVCARCVCGLGGSPAANNFRTNQKMLTR
jgi:hypothetical protein